MSERSIAERHEFTRIGGGPCLMVRWNDGEILVEVNGQEVSFDDSSFSICLELLCVVHERDSLRALAARQHALLLAEETLFTEEEPGPHCPTCLGVHDGDEQHHADDCERAALLRDEHGRRALADSQDVLAGVTTLSEQRNALIVLLQSVAERLSVLPHDECGELAIIQEKIDAALRDAGLLPEEGR